MSPSIPARGLLGLIQLYKWTLSPLIGNACRYRPTCSSYAADCVRMHGAWAGSWMAGARLCRCAPWGGHGWDPAPREIRTNSWWRPWRYGDWKGGYRPPPVSSPASGVSVIGEANDEGGATAPTVNGEAHLPLSHASRDSSPASGGANKKSKL
ncbi:MAG: membrane protein insertion efficiency factor YidD [Hyphomonadaceae bacterium]|nr:membrane protein insertion efficiency factor YidD [Hyphomonadaceae bacterium]